MAFRRVWFRGKKPPAIGKHSVRAGVAEGLVTVVQHKQSGLLVQAMHCNSDTDVYELCNVHDQRLFAAPTGCLLQGHAPAGRDCWCPSKDSCPAIHS